MTASNLYLIPVTELKDGDRITIVVWERDEYDQPVPTGDYVLKTVTDVRVKPRWVEAKTNGIQHSWPLDRHLLIERPASIAQATTISWVGTPAWHEARSYLDVLAYGWSEGEPQEGDVFLDTDDPELRFTVMFSNGEWVRERL